MCPGWLSGPLTRPLSAGPAIPRALRLAHSLDSFFYAQQRGGLDRLRSPSCRNAINPFLAVAGDPDGHPLTEEEFRRANLGPAKAQLALVNAIRRSLGRNEEELQVFIGGSFTRPEDWPEMA